MNQNRNFTNLHFNPNPSTIMHIDLNSCFATIEQQANPLLRKKAIAVAAYDTPSGCIVAPSVEAKMHGIKTGMRVREGKNLYPGLIVLTPDPNKYRFVHLKLRKLLSKYTNDFSPKSIDEFVLQMQDSPVLKIHLHTRSGIQYSNIDVDYSPGVDDLSQNGSFDNSTPEESIRPPQGCGSNDKVQRLAMKRVAEQIKKDIKKKIGEWLTVSVGIAPNRFLAKTASGLHKPDGLDEINRSNFLETYETLKLVDLSGIAKRNKARLNSVGIYSVIDFYNADLQIIKAAFKSIGSYYWYLRLRGWEIDDEEFARRSYGNSYALPKPFVEISDLSPILSKLVTKMSGRLRSADYKAKGVHLSIYYKDGSFWHKGEGYESALFDTKDIYKKAYRLLEKSPREPVGKLAVSCFNLVSADREQLAIFEDIEKKRKLNEAMDDINNRWGEYVVAPARMLSAKENVPDRIAFGGVKELEEFTKSYYK